MSHILTFNAGSSSIKFALFRSAEPAETLLRGQVDGLGAGPRLSLSDGSVKLVDTRLPPEKAPDHQKALHLILDLLDRHMPGLRPAAVGHRVVHGGPDASVPEFLDDDRITYLQGLVPLAPLHQRHNLAGIQATRAAFPDATQIACYDTAFHRAHPWTADTYALPRAFYDKGIRRYGFHGLAYEFAARELGRRPGTRDRNRWIVAHLGNGASVCAMAGGRSMSSSMGLSVLDGLPMGTRCGQIDPGVILYLLREEAMTPDQIEDLLYHRSGLKGLSGLSHDMRDLEAAGTRAANAAIDYFVDRICREVAAQAAAVGGIDALGFSGGIGENAATIRARVCDRLGWLGIGIDGDRNDRNAPSIAAEGAQVAVEIIRADEERVIARHCQDLLGTAGPRTL